MSGVAIVFVGLIAATAIAPTDFGIREVPTSSAAGKDAAFEAPLKPFSSGKRLDIGPIKSLALKWGSVTSTLRSPQRNRAVGGAVNSYHLSGRAIDIARRSGVRHSDIEAAYIRAGYRLLESLDEGDHSHFAFALDGGEQRTTPRSSKRIDPYAGWRIVSAPKS